MKVANTGQDPSGNLKEFIKKDVISNIDIYSNRAFTKTEKPSEFHRTLYTSCMQNRNKWAIGTTKYTKDKVDDNGNILQ